jgi:hypothetical protein
MQPDCQNLELRYVLLLPLHSADGDSFSFSLGSSGLLAGLAASFPWISISLTKLSDIFIHKQIEAAAVTSRLGAVSGIHPFVFLFCCLR